MESHSECLIKNTGSACDCGVTYYLWACINKGRERDWKWKSFRVLLLAVPLLLAKCKLSTPSVLQSHSYLT